MEAHKVTTRGNTVRAPGAPFTRPRTALSRKVSINRESNALRASVLDVAMQIGLGANGAVTDWVYNNSLKEEDEDSAGLSPSLTNGSSATSEDFFSTTPSTRSPNSPYSPHSLPSSSRSISSARSLFSSSKLFSPGAFSIPEESSSIIEEGTKLNSSAAAASVSFSDPSMQLPSVSVRLPAKLRKRRTDGYESEGGYMSDSKSKKKDKKGKLDGDSSLRGQKVGSGGEFNVSGENARLPKEEKDVEKKQKEAARHRAKSLTTQRSEKDMKPDDNAFSKGYETDASARRRFGKKKRAGTADAGYETDAGYLSSRSPAKKSRSKFFRLGGKSSKLDLAAQNASKEAKEPAPTVLPIAQKFGTTLGKNEPSTGSSLPTLPPLPSLDSSLSPTTLTQNTLPQSSSSPVSSPSAAVFRVGSESLKKDSLSDKGPRDSHVSGESSRSSISYASTGVLQDGKASKRKPFRFLTSAKSSPTLSGSSNKFPAISLPLTRATSPAPPDTSITVNQSQDRPDPISPDTLFSPSPSPSKTRTNVEAIRGQHNTPLPSAFLSPAAQQRSVSPALLTPNSPSVVVTNTASSPSPPTVKGAPSLRPRNSILSVNTHLSLSSPTSSRRFSRGGSPSPIPSSEWIVPSPSATSSMSQPSAASSGTLPVPSPNMYSYFDIPPPSPPPNGPLPKVPDMPKGDPEDDPFGVNGASVIRSLSTADRVKDVPFLSRLKARASSRDSPKVTNPASPAVANGRTPTKERISPPYPAITRSIDKRGSDGSKKSQELEFNDDDNSSGLEIQDVLDRFAEAYNIHRGEFETTGRAALGRHRSSEALRSEARPSRQRRENGGGDLDDPESFHSQEIFRKRRSTIYYSDEEDGVDPRTSRWSGSIYSRASFMDPQKSEETRARFVKKVEAMLDEAGIERGNKRDWDAVPPVPKLPEDLAKSNLLTRQNQLKGAGLTGGVSGWI